MLLPQTKLQAETDVKETVNDQNMGRHKIGKPISNICMEIVTATADLWAAKGL